MNILFYLTAFLFSFGQLGRISFFNQQINIYLYEIALTLSLLLFFFKYRLKPIKEVWEKYKPIFFFLAILLITLLISLVKYSLFENIVAFLYFLRLVLYFTYWTYLTYLCKKNPDSKKVLQNGILIIAVATIITTITQYFLYPDLRNLFYQGWDPHLYRTFGLFFDTSISAAIFGIFFLIINQPIIKIFYLVLIALSFSRSIYLGLSLTLIYLFISQKQFKKIVLFLLFFIALIFFIPKPAGEGVNLTRLYSISSRIEDYRQGIELWKKQPIFGYGYNRIRFIKKSESVHSGSSFSSSFLTILVSSGVVGLITFLWALWSFRKLNKLAVILLTFLCIISLFDNILLHPFILFLLFISLTSKP